MSPVRMRVLVCMCLFVLGAACSGDDEDIAAPSSTAGSTSTTVLAPPPWAGPPLARAAVPGVLLTEWQRSSGGEECPPLAFAEAGAGQGAEPRRADFGPGGWAVAWDLPGAPGALPSGQPSPTAGRSTFGLAGAGSLPDAGFDWPYDRTWADGSRAGYGVEGGEAEEPAGKWLAYVRMQGRTCLYNVWSHLGRAHLEHLLGALRRVEGA